jgi:serine/threonine-protein kinase
MKTLGAGGFGAVVLARHDATGTPVAIKFLRPNLLADQGFAALFRAEAVTLGAVDSPYVVRLYEYVEAPAGAAIVMELVDGVSLHEIVARQGKTAPEAALVVLYGSLLGLAAAHARGVVHRDFKPANVLVNAYGASKLTDFGIAARTGSTTVPAGSLSYAPPEQFDGGPATPASDVYAATATFYECLTGQPPFRGDTADELIAAHRSAPVPLEAVPEALRPVVAAGMAKDPGQRPVNALTLAAELRAAAAAAYGADWADRGVSHLRDAAVLLAALWPTGGAPSVHGFTAEQVQLSRGQQAAGNQHVHGQQVPHGAQHNVHQWHVLHREHLQHERSLQRAVRHSGHLLRTTMAVLTTAAVAAAVGTVVATRNSANTAPSAAPSPDQSAVAVFPVALQSTSRPPSPQSPRPQSPSPLSPSPQSPSPQQPTPQQASPQQPSPRSPTPQGPAPGDYPVNRQIPNSESWLVTLTDIRVLPSGQAEFFVVYDNNGPYIEQMTCLGNTDPSVNKVALSNGQTVAATADYCSQHPGDANISINSGQTFTSYAIFPDAAQLTKPFDLSWAAEGLAGGLEDLQLPA